MGASRLQLEQRFALCKLLRRGREQQHLTAEQLAERAEGALRALATAANGDATDEDRLLWARVDVSRHHVARLETLAGNPLGNPERRARLLGIVIVLELDRAEVNRLCGGL